jgi:opacity protein-like surface antigen
VAPSSDAYVKLFFEDLTFAYRLGKKYNIVANTGFESVKGGSQTQIAPNGKHIDQFGYAFGGGIDYDFTPTAGIHLRHKWMSHKDKNFVLDQFKGQETTLELKVFF